MHNANLEPLFEKIANLCADLVPEEFKMIVARYRRVGSLQETLLVYEPQCKLGFYRSGIIVNEPLPPHVVAFSDLWERCAAVEKAPWSSATCVISDDGDFSIDFGYDDFDHVNFAEWHFAWEKKYLGELKFAR